MRSWLLHSCHRDDERENHLQLTLPPPHILAYARTRPFDEEQTREEHPNKEPLATCPVGNGTIAEP